MIGFLNGLLLECGYGYRLFPKDVEIDHLEIYDNEIEVYLKNGIDKIAKKLEVSVDMDGYGKFAGYYMIEFGNITFLMEME